MKQILPLLLSLSIPTAFAAEPSSLGAWLPCLKALGYAASSPSPADPSTRALLPTGNYAEAVLVTESGAQVIASSRSNALGEPEFAFLLPGTNAWAITAKSENAFRFMSFGHMARRASDLDPIRLLPDEEAKRLIELSLQRYRGREENSLFYYRQGATNYYAISTTSQYGPRDEVLKRIRSVLRNSRSRTFSEQESLSACEDAPSEVLRGIAREEAGRATQVLKVIDEYIRRYE